MAKKIKANAQQIILYDGAITTGLLRAINDLPVGATLEVTNFSDVSGLRYFETQLLNNPASPLGDDRRAYIRRADEHMLSYKMVRLQDLPEE